jgi:predicted nucleotide-binding protein
LAKRPFGTWFFGENWGANVCVLHEDGVEIPSDYQGVVFVPFDKQNGWRMQLVSELLGANLPVGAKKAFKK